MNKIVCFDKIIEGIQSSGLVFGNYYIIPNYIGDITYLIDGRYYSSYLFTEVSVTDIVDSLNKSKELIDINKSLIKNQKEFIKLSVKIMNEMKDILL